MPEKFRGNFFMKFNILPGNLCYFKCTSMWQYDIIALCLFMS